MALIILRVEPRALSHPAAHPGCHQCSTDGQRSVQWCTWEDGVYHGVYTRGIPGRVPLSHTRVYQEEYHSPYPGIPQGVHPSPGYTTGCTSLTWLYLRVYTTMGVPLRVYTTMGVPLMCATLLGVPQVCYTVGCTSGCAPKVGIPRGVLLRWVYHGVWGVNVSNAGQVRVNVSNAGQVRVNVSNVGSHRGFIGVSAPFPLSFSPFLLPFPLLFSPFWSGMWAPIGVLSGFSLGYSLGCLRCISLFYTILTVLRGNARYIGGFTWGWDTFLSQKQGE